MQRRFSDVLKDLRTCAKLTQEQLAKKMDVDSKTIYRYEGNQSTPDANTLKRLAVYFRVSTDYLLGLEMEETVDKKILLQQYAEAKKALTYDDTAKYYWISSDRFSHGGQTEWVGWADKACTKEVRRLRFVNPAKAIDMYKIAWDEDMLVINSKETVDLFLMFGGEAIVRVDICHKYLSWFEGPYICDGAELEKVTLAAYASKA